jgi:hypothetical protein
MELLAVNAQGRLTQEAAPCPAIAAAVIAIGLLLSHPAPAGSLGPNNRARTQKAIRDFDRGG